MAVSVAVLHHLPDFCKVAALTRCRAMLKPEGKLYLFDVVFPSGEANLEDRIDEWIASIATKTDARLAQKGIRNETLATSCRSPGVPFLRLSNPPPVFLSYIL